jgi:acyl-CoA thioesterase
MSDLNHHPIIQKYIEFNAFGRLIGMSFNITQPGIVDYSLSIQAEHLATPKAAHGGLIAGFLDAVVGVGALSVVCEEGMIVSTVEMKVSYFEPVLLGDQILGKSKMMKRGKRILFMEGEVLNQHGVLVAKASATLNAYPAPIKSE